MTEFETYNRKTTKQTSVNLAPRVSWTELPAMDYLREVLGEFTTETTYKTLLKKLPVGASIKGEYAGHLVEITSVESKNGKHYLKCIQTETRKDGVQKQYPSKCYPETITRFYSAEDSFEGGEAPTEENIFMFAYNGEPSTVLPHSKEDAKLALKTRENTKFHLRKTPVYCRKLMDGAEREYGIRIHAPVRAWQAWIVLVVTYQQLAVKAKN